MNVIPERIIFVSRGITVLFSMLFKHTLSEFQQGFIFSPINKVNTASAEMEQNEKATTE